MTNEQQTAQGSQTRVDRAADDWTTGDWATHIVVGGGSAGCVVAARLSEEPRNRVLLLEAGPDYTRAQMPPELLDTYAALAVSMPEYFWSGLNVLRGPGEHIPPAARAPFYFYQGRVIGGGSTINGQVAIRGAPGDYDEWGRIGAEGWNRDAVLPWFLKLENDLDFRNLHHGNDGPIRIRRVMPAQWDSFTEAVAADWKNQGQRYVEDMNGEFAEGYSPIPLSNDGKQRSSTALGYLDDAARQRPNLKIVGGATVVRILFKGNAVDGVQLRLQGRELSVRAPQVVVSAGTYHTPQLLMLSGIGPGAHLQQHGIPVVADRGGVGSNLHDHPLISVSAYLPPRARGRPFFRRNYAYMRYSSHADGCDPTDMVMMAVCRSQWHAIGERIATLSTYVGIPFSRGTVRLRSSSFDDRPAIANHWLTDGRDRQRLNQAFRRMGEMLLNGESSKQCHDPFPSSFSARVARISRPTPLNRIVVGAGARLLDGPAPLRRFIMNRIVSEAPDLQQLLGDAQAMDRYVCSAVRSAWHPVGSCRMGARDDPMAVTDGRGAVIGVSGLHIADASLMPRISSTNPNLPTIMLGERIAEFVKVGRAG